MEIKEDNKKNNNEEENAEEFIKKICELYKDDAKAHDYIVWIKSLESDLNNGENLKLYLQKLIDFTQKLIKEDREAGESFLNTYFLHALKCFSEGFQRNIYKVNDDRLYRDVCSRIIAFINSLKEQNVNTDKIYDVYGMEFLRKMEACRNLKIRKAADIKYQSVELICDIDEAEERLYHKGKGLWYKGHSLEVRNIVLNARPKPTITPKTEQSKTDDEER